MPDSVASTLRALTLAIHQARLLGHFQGHRFPGKVPCPPQKGLFFFFVIALDVHKEQLFKQGENPGVVYVATRRLRCRT